ncbi:type II toxin-antitoxin system VapC family toxin [Rhizobium sp. L1K21]|uniref:type II toxin-antitoxin system VapC family toxin n=1 Tax=Rhizobium sp. L1K21 TaxID=2954933 RepID=UPI002092A84F|nr:type II toxin-antitoxin system VapC family toxin [Rhizobium sp. L1K21]MCO6185602.1 type II toxin-antitoxin system VapC family toxin [Rhizobium sp. L1K21]
MTIRYIFDTCCLLFLSQPGISIEPDARQALKVAGGGFHVSAISAWEIGLLVAKGRLNLTRPPLEWFNMFVEDRSMNVLEVTPSILVGSSFLPEPLHGDPADRIIIATAREYDLKIITRDKAILAYGAAGHVKTLAC